MAHYSTRHLPLTLLLLAAVLSMASCQHDEPRGHSPGRGGTTITPVDTTHTPSDTTHTPVDTTTHSTDTTRVLTLELSAPRDYGYMGQSLQLTAVTSHPVTVEWSSSNTLAATVDSHGLVTMSNVTSDAQTVITATADTVSRSMVIRCLYWTVAALDGEQWSTQPYHQVHPGDTLVLTLVGSCLTPIDDNGFNSAACQWSVSSRQADAATLMEAIETPSAANGWQWHHVIAPTAPAGTTFTVMAQLGGAASALTCTIVP